MIENMVFIIEKSDDTWSIVAIGSIIGFTTHPNEVEEIIESFCIDHDINFDSAEIYRDY